MADNGVLASIMDITKLKVPDLKRELKNRGLSTNGNKNELIERLKTALNASEKASNESVDDLEEDLLNEDDEDVHLDTSESIINDIDTITGNLTQKQQTNQQQLVQQEQQSTQQQKEESQLQSPKKLKRKLDETTTNGDSKTNQPTKKVILNRNNPAIDDKRLSIDSKEDSIKTNDASPDEKRIIKLSGVSAKERLEMRAKKFDVTALSPAAKKIARAERFGIAVNSTNTNITNSPIDTKVDTSLDVLKRRAERFGGSVSKAMSNIESQERLEKRKARFGIVSDADKAKQRLERFKQPVK